jgi:hypothetical protein
MFIGLRSRWSALDSGVNAEVLALAKAGNSLFVGGYFSTAGGRPSNGIAVWRQRRGP